MKITPSDRLHQEYLSIILGVLVIDSSCSCLYWGSVSDGGADSLTQSLTESFTHSLSKENAGAGAVCCQFSFQTLMQLVRMAPTVLYSGCKGQRAVPRHSPEGTVIPLCPKDFQQLLRLPKSWGLLANEARRLKFLTEFTTNFSSSVIRNFGHFFVKNFEVP